MGWLEQIRSTLSGSARRADGALDDRRPGRRVTGGVPADGDAPGTRLTRPAATAPTYGNTTSGGHSGKRGQAANRKKGSRGGRPVSHDADLYKERNAIERLINNR